MICNKSCYKFYYDSNDIKILIFSDLVFISLFSIEGFRVIVVW